MLKCERVWWQGQGIRRLPEKGKKCLEIEWETRVHKSQEENRVNVVAMSKAFFFFFTNPPKHMERSERIMRVVIKVNKEQESLRKEERCTDLKKSRGWKKKEKVPYIKDRKLYAAFTDLEKVCKRVDWNALWNVLKMMPLVDCYAEEVTTFFTRKPV